MQRYSNKIQLQAWIACALAVSTISCAPSSDLNAQSAEAAGDFNDARIFAIDCAGKWDLCHEAHDIAGKAFLQADNYFQSEEDPSDLDGKRDAFKHIVAWTWITLRFGNQFATWLSNKRDPDPKSYRESNPQVVCQRRMDRINDDYAIIRATSLARECGIPTNRRATKNDWDDYDNQGAWNCIAQVVADAIRSSKSATVGPVTIARDPKDAKKCWIVPSSKDIGTHGRPKSKSNF